MSGGDFVLPKIGGVFVRGAFVRGGFCPGGILSWTRERERCLCQIKLCNIVLDALM